MPSATLAGDRGRKERSLMFSWAQALCSEAARVFDWFVSKQWSRGDLEQHAGVPVWKVGWKPAATKHAHLELEASLACVKDPFVYPS